MSAVPECSVVVPVYNSRECLAELARRLRSVFHRLQIPYEIILVDDGSADGSWEVIRSLAGEVPLCGVSFRKNFGQDNALMAGLRRARGRYVVVMDDDLQHDPEHIERLLEEIRKGYDVVYCNYARDRRQKLWKNAGSRFNGLAAQLVLGKPRSVYLSPYKAISARLLPELCSYDGAYPYLDGLLLRMTRNIGQIFADHAPRYRGESQYTVAGSLLVWSNLTTNFSVLPLRVATFLGLLFSLFGLASASVFLVNKLLDPELPVGWTSLFVSVNVLGGITLFAIGVVGEYVGRAYLCLNKHPQYSVRDAFTSGLEPQDPGDARLD